MSGKSFKKTVEIWLVAVNVWSKSTSLNWLKMFSVQLRISAWEKHNIQLLPITSLLSDLQWFMSQLQQNKLTPLGDIFQNLSSDLVLKPEVLKPHNFIE